MRVFSQRVLDFYHIGDELESKRPLVLTFIDRKKRFLVDKEKYIKGLKSKFPGVDIRLVDFAALPFSEQVKMARATDILVGVHGAGMTQGIFLPPGSTMVEILPPNLGHKGYRNLAKLLGHRYFSSHGIEHPTIVKTGDWHDEEVFLEEDRFMSLLEVSVKSMYNSGTHNIDIS